MTREQEFEAALAARARAEEARRIRAHARFLATQRPDLNRTARLAILVDARQRWSAVA